jgi:fermentation-respiration switch protein FrsA (DUF1100 family)
MWLLRAAAVAMGLYAVVCAGARLTYRHFVYPAPALRAAAASSCEALVLRASDGQSVKALWFAPPPGARVVAYFHGNGETVEDELPLARDLQSRGLGVLLVEYRGYGASAAGTPTEAGLYADAEAALEEAARRGVGPERIGLWGTSLGAAVAAEMARRGRGAVAVLVSPFTSLTAVAARAAWWLPVAMHLPDRYDTLSKAPQIRVPTLVVHGNRDELIPFTMGEAVAKAIPGAQFIPVEGAGHGDVYARGGGELMRTITIRLLR